MFVLFFFFFSVTQLLERIGEVVEQNHLFASEGPTLGEELESLQQHLESLSSAQSPLESSFNTSHGLEIPTQHFSQQLQPKTKLTELVRRFKCTGCNFYSTRVTQYNMCV